MRLSVTGRIALLSIALALLSNLAIVGFVWKRTHDDAIDLIRRDTVEQSAALRSAYHDGGMPDLRQAVDDAVVPGDRGVIVALFDDAGRRIAGTGPAMLPQPIFAWAFQIAALSGSDGREAGYALHRVGRVWLLNGRLLDLDESGQRTIERALAVSVLLSLILGIGAGVVVSRYVGRRLYGIVDVVEAVGAGDLARRVDLAGGGRRRGAGDAFDRLAARLNAMLDRLERLVEELRVVTDGLAHDLRSPLARLQARAETAALAGDPAQRDAALALLVGETDLVMRMLTTAIEISRYGAVGRDRFASVDPAALVAEMAEFYAPVMDEAGVALTLDLNGWPTPGPTSVPMHRELMSQALANLLDNALGHAAAGGAVSIALNLRPGALAISVGDRGSGIAAADRAEALRRFGRLDRARTRPGAGLGLALVEAVARLHDGVLELGDNAPGLVATIAMPIDGEGVRLSADPVPPGG